MTYCVGGSTNKFIFCLNNVVCCTTNVLWNSYCLSLLNVLCAESLSPMDYSLPGSSVHGILQARILEWVAISFSRVSSQPRDWNCVSYVSCIGRQVLYHYHHLGGPNSVLSINETFSLLILWKFVNPNSLKEILSITGINQNILNFLDLLCFRI